MGERINRLRKERDLSFRAMAEAMEARYGITLSGTAVHKWCRKGGNITESHLQMLADFFGKSVAYIRYGIDDPDENVAAILRAMQGMTEQERRVLRDLAQTLQKKSA